MLREGEAINHEKFEKRKRWHKKEKRVSVREHVPSHPFFLLFLLSLLFLTEDSVFMENEIDRDEYVLADFGYIWVGSARRNEGIPWQFGQVRDSL